MSDNKINIICYVDGGFDTVNKKNPYGSIRIFHENTGKEIYYSGKKKFTTECTAEGFSPIATIDSSNKTEYSIIIELFSYLIKNIERFEAITVCSDSRLVINQLTNVWKTREPTLKPFYKHAKLLLYTLLRETNGNTTLMWVGRNTMVRLLGH